MKRLHVLRPSPAMIVALIALIVALGGTAYAAKKIGSRQLKKNAVTTKKIKDGAVTAAKIATGAIASTNVDITALNQPVPTIDPGDVGGATASCPAGKKAIAGGGLSDPSINGVFIEDSRPVTGTTTGATQGGTFTGWRVIWANTAPQLPANPTVYVVCLG